MEILYVLLVLLVITRAFGELATNVGQPTLVGELVAGIVLGTLARGFSETFPILSALPENPVFTAITDLGVFFLMLMAGIEMHPKDLVQASRTSFLIAVCGLALPLAMGFGLGWVFLPDSDAKLAQALFIGTALAITAVPVAVRVLMELGQLDTRAGQTIVGAAVFDDVLSLILLAVLTALLRTGGLPDASELVWLVARTGLFFVVALTLGAYLFPILGQWVRRLKSDELDFTFLVVVALAFSVLAELLHLHFILGAFIAGLFFSRRTIYAERFQDVERKVSAITAGFLAPVFFASIGFHLDVTAFTGIPGFLLLLIAVAFFSKLIGAGVPAYLVGAAPRTSLAIGVAMSARGAVELIIADIALRADLFSQPDPPPPVVAHLFSAIVIVAVVTTVLVPVVLRFLMRPPDSKSGGR